MDLKRNICDSVKECEIKLGYREEPITLYYPENALLELLSVQSDNLAEAIKTFCHAVSGELGEVNIVETKEKGRYQITIPEKGVAFVHDKVQAGSFLRAFVAAIYQPGMTKEDVVRLFRRFSDDVIVERVEEKEWAVYFADPSIDAYVYYIEEDDFGIQYHRFTKESYQALRKS